MTVTSGANARREPHSTKTISLRSSRRTELINITAEIQELVAESGCAAGVCHIYVPHTTAGVIINEGYDPAVAHDIEAAFDCLVPRVANSTHAEGNSDSHVKTMLVGMNLFVFVDAGKLVLGRWQGIFFAEFDGPRERKILVKVLPDRV